MRTTQLLDRRTGVSRGVHLGLALRANTADTAPTGVDDTLDGVLTSIEVWDHGALVAYREPTLGRAS